NAKPSAGEHDRMAKNLRKGAASSNKAGTKTKMNGNDFEKHDSIGLGDDFESPAAVEAFDDAEAFGFDDEEHAEAVHEDDSSVDATDDPVRMYLMQMGQIPLLTRKQEVSAAKQIERCRVRFRHSMLATDYVLQGAVELLEKVKNAELRLDRT